MNPVKMTKDDLLKVLRQITAHVEANDSFDGSLEYHIVGTNEFEVLAAFRIGNSEGQGGCVSIGSFNEVLE